MVLFNYKTLFELSSKQVVDRYIVRLLVATGFATLPLIYSYIGVKGTSMIFIFLIVELLAYASIKRQFKNYLKGGRRPRRTDYVLISVTAIISPLVSGLLFIAVIPGLVVSAFVYPVRIVRSLLDLNWSKVVSHRNDVK